MAKASTPGLTKTRLVPPLTYDEAAALNTAFLQDVIDNMLLAARRAAPYGGIAVFAAYGPPGSEEFFRRNLPASVGLIETWLPNFGDCLHHAMCAMFAQGCASAVVLNADSPTLPTAYLVEAAQVLARPGECAVLGPSSDGGYYLLGLKAPHRRMFEDIAWSTARVGEQTRERAREIGLELHLLPEWYDVDDVGTLKQVRNELCACGPAARPGNAGGPHLARRTRSLLNRLWPQGDFGHSAVIRIEKAPV